MHVSCSICCVSLLSPFPSPVLYEGRMCSKLGSLDFETDCSLKFYYMIMMVSLSPLDSNTKEQRSLLSLLISSTDKERRLGALECLSRESHQMPNSIQVDLVNLIITETDQRCVVVALEMFVEVCGGLDTCLLSYADLKILCDKLTSFAGQTRGVSVAGKAIPAHSIALKFITSCQQTNSLVLQALLSEWREFIETFCQWEQDEVLRLGAVQSLQYFGVTVLWYAMKCKEKSDLEQPCFVETAIRYEELFGFCLSE